MLPYLLFRHRPVVFLKAVPYVWMKLHARFLEASNASLGHVNRFLYVNFLVNGAAPQRQENHAAHTAVSRPLCWLVARLTSTTLPCNRKNRYFAKTRYQTTFANQWVALENLPSSSPTSSRLPTGHLVVPARSLWWTRSSQSLKSSLMVSRRTPPTVRMDSCTIHLQLDENWATVQQHDRFCSLMKSASARACPSAPVAPQECLVYPTCAKATLFRFSVSERGTLDAPVRLTRSVL